jgi:hypothetical protein
VRSGSLPSRIAFEISDGGAFGFAS